MNREDVRREHGELYDVPFLYDLAFSYRDYTAECAFLAATYERVSGRRLDRFLEIAAGPAGHARALAERGVRCAALDLSPEMRRYALARARERDVSLAYELGDMKAFAVSEPCALAACMLDSASYLLDDGAVDAHLHCVADALDPGGVYVLELQAPPDPADDWQKTQSSWEICEDHGSLRVHWEAEAPPPARGSAHVVSFRAKFSYRASDGSLQEVESSGRQRGFRHEELAELIRRNGRFRIARTLGGLDLAVPLADPRAWRMVPVLQRI